MDSYASVGIPVIAGLIAIGLIFTIRQIIIKKQKGKEIKQILVSITIASGVALISLIYAYIKALTL